MGMAGEPADDSLAGRARLTTSLENNVTSFRLISPKEGRVNPDALSSASFKAGINLWADFKIHD
jgi:hypothetical protein